MYLLYTKLIILLKLIHFTTIDNFANPGKLAQLCAKPGNLAHFEEFDQVSWTKPPMCPSSHVRQCDGRPGPAPLFWPYTPESCTYSVRRNIHGRSINGRPRDPTPRAKGPPGRAAAIGDLLHCGLRLPGGYAYRLVR